MFEKGEYIVYGVNGICRVEEICASPFDKNDTRTYYLLVPVHNPMGSTIYTPVDNQRVPMRRLMTAEEIDALIAKMPRVELLDVPVEKQRRETYRTTIADLRPEGYVSVIKTVHRRREELTAARKHVPVSDLEYGRLAKHLLYSECAHVLGMEEDGIEAYIEEKLAMAE
ncbi:MAG: CarD family transcriptional regulator [Ruminococcaceae bacterium]|nr:CarD family transcriptional regulator [Oscillospiraceae bacterium]